MKETREVRRSLQRSSLFSGWLLRRRVFFWRLLRFITTPSSGGTVLARIRPDEAAEQHTALHARIAGQVIHLLAFAVMFVRTSPGAHVSFPDKFVSMPCAPDPGDRLFLRALAQRGQAVHLRDRAQQGVMADALRGPAGLDHRSGEDRGEAVAFRA